MLILPKQTNAMPGTPTGWSGRLVVAMCRMMIPNDLIDTSGAEQIGLTLASEVAFRCTKGRAA